MNNGNVKLKDNIIFINMNILQLKKHYHLIKVEKMEQAKFTYAFLGNAFGQQTKTIKELEKNKQMLLQIKTNNNH